MANEILTTCGVFPIDPTPFLNKMNTGHPFLFLEEMDRESDTALMTTPTLSHVLLPLEEQRVFVSDLPKIVVGKIFTQVEDSCR